MNLEFNSNVKTTTDITSVIFMNIWNILCLQTLNCGRECLDFQLPSVSAERMGTPNQKI